MPLLCVGSLRLWALCGCRTSGAAYGAPTLAAVEADALFLRLSAELKEFWKAYDAAADTNAGLGVGAAPPAGDKAASEAADKAADALADSLGSVKVEDAKPAAA